VTRKNKGRSPSAVEKREEEKEGGGGVFFLHSLVKKREKKVGRGRGKSVSGALIRK